MEFIMVEDDVRDVHIPWRLVRVRAVEQQSCAAARPTNEPGRCQRQQLTRRLVARADFAEARRTWQQRRECRVGFGRNERNVIFARIQSVEHAHSLWERSEGVNIAFESAYTPSSTDNNQMRLGLEFRCLFIFYVREICFDNWKVLGATAFGMQSQWFHRDTLDVLRSGQ